MPHSLIPLPPSGAIRVSHLIIGWTGSTFIIQTGVRERISNEGVEYTLYSDMLAAYNGLSLALEIHRLALRTGGEIPRLLGEILPFVAPLGTFTQ